MFRCGVLYLKVKRKCSSGTWNAFAQSWLSLFSSVSEPRSLGVCIGIRLACLTTYRGQFRPWHRSCLYPLGGFLREVSQWLTLREGNLHVHHGAGDHLPQSSGPWDLHDRARRQFKSGATDNGRLSGTTRLRVGQGILGASSALSHLEVQRLGLPVRQSRSA